MINITKELLHLYREPSEAPFMLITAIITTTNTNTYLFQGMLSITSSIIITAN